MKRCLCAAIAAALGLLVQRSLAQVGPDIGPGEGGATLKQPWEIAPANKPNPPAKSAPTYIEGILKQNQAGQPASTPNLPQGAAPQGAVPQARPAWWPKETPDINKDIQVTPDKGQWLLMIQGYRGPEAPQMAREMVMELRNTYKLNAYVYNYGAEERRKEFERAKKEYDRIKAIYEQQRGYAEKNKLEMDQRDAPIRVKVMSIDEHVAVLIGGYGSDAAAKAAKDRISELPMPNPAKVKLDRRIDAEEMQSFEGRKIVASKIQKTEETFLNPFKRTLIVRNPTIKTDRPADADKLDMALLRKLNAREEYSLLNSKKPVTLAVKMFQTPTVVQSTKDTPKGGFLEAIGLGKKEKVDIAATNAHEIARLLRQAKLEAYVLHSKYNSVVTVGAFDSAEDPNLRSMQSLLVTRLDQVARELNTRLQASGQAGQARFEFFPVPVPMQVPR